MPPGYTTTQKNAISQFMAFTSTDKNTAVRHLKSHNWNQELAVNGYFSGGSGAPASSISAKSSLNKIFDKYRDPNSPDSVLMEGMAKYLGDISVSIEDIGMLAVSEIVQSATMGEMSREGFVEGWSTLNADSIDKQKAYMKNLVKSLPHPGSKDTFTKIYKYTFQIARSGNQKAIPLEMALAYWQLLFSSASSPTRWKTDANPWLDWWTEFLESKWKKSVNKDMWTETLKFAQQCLEDESLSFWNEEASWPSVVDEFVEWVGEKRGKGVEAEEMEVE